MDQLLAIIYAVSHSVFWGLMHFIIHAMLLVGHFYLF
uniref:Uncharacterized protein n=1 Tax=Arundo donax TaxID=35708 RepID=A0A0A9H3U3_ARUDO